jgi:hypothetical protein
MGDKFGRKEQFKLTPIAISKVAIHHYKKEKDYPTNCMTSEQKLIYDVTIVGDMIKDSGEQSYCITQCNIYIYMLYFLMLFNRCVYKTD